MARVAGIRHRHYTGLYFTHRTIVCMVACHPSCMCISTNGRVNVDEYELLADYQEKYAGTEPVFIAAISNDWPSDECLHGWLLSLNYVE